MKTEAHNKPNSPGFQRGPGSGQNSPWARFRQPVEKATNIKDTLRRLWSYLRQQQAGLILTIVMVIASTLLNLLGPALIGITIDRHLLGGIDYPGLLKAVIILAIIYATAGILALLQEWIMLGVAQKAVQKLRNDLFYSYQQLPLGFFDKRQAGELMSRITNDIENISNTLATGSLEFLSGILSIAGVIIIMLLQSWQLALVCLLIIPLVVFITKKIATHSRSGFRHQAKALGAINGQIEESIYGQRIVQAFNKEEELCRTFSIHNQELRRAARKANIYAGFMGPIMNLMNNLNYAVTAFAGGILAANSLVSIGTIAAFLSYTRQFARPLNQLAHVYNNIQSAIAGAERVFEIIDEKPEYADSPQPAATRLAGHVVCKDLHFGYHAHHPVIKGISFQALPGQSIALVGPTGAGKTTIVSILSRFYDYQQGSVSIDGRELQSYDRRTLRSNLGVVLQDTFLFAASVRENLRFGRLEASDQEIIAAAKIANAHQFIHRMPDGYDTKISEGGSNLSQGQKQLLAISRAILADPAILILDEATSSVDTRTEVQIQKAMLELMKGRTSFIIAHRLSTIKNVDTILVMDQGRIVETGSHHELLERQGFYYSLYRSQFGIA